MGAQVGGNSNCIPKYLWLIIANSCIAADTFQVPLIITGQGARMSGKLPTKDTVLGLGADAAGQSGVTTDLMVGISRFGASRRDFIKGIIATGASVSAGFMLSGCSQESAPTTPSNAATTPAPGGVERLISLNVNGEVRRVDVLPNETLAMTLRYKLGLTGTKLGCDRGECGACTVLIDDVALYSCSTLTHSVRGRSVTTIEGLQGPDGALHPVQQAFVDELGPQCGFCTPGQVVAAIVL